MNLAMALTVGRIALAPVFFLLYRLTLAGSPFMYRLLAQTRFTQVPDCNPNM